MSKKKVPKQQLSFLRDEEGTPLFSNSCQRDQSLPFIPKPQFRTLRIPGFELTFDELAAAAQAKRFSNSQADSDLPLLNKEANDDS